MSNVLVMETENTSASDDFTLVLEEGTKSDDDVISENIPSETSIETMKSDCSDQKVSVLPERSSNTACSNDVSVFENHRSDTLQISEDDNDLEVKNIAGTSKHQLDTSPYANTIGETGKSDTDNIDTIPAEGIIDRGMDTEEVIIAAHSILTEEAEIDDGRSDVDPLVDESNRMENDDYACVILDSDDSCSDPITSDNSNTTMNSTANAKEAFNNHDTAHENSIIKDETDATKKETNNVNLETEKVTESLRAIFRKKMKSLTRTQLEDLVIQKLCEAINESSHVGELKRSIKELTAKEQSLRKTIDNQDKQIKQLMSVHCEFNRVVKNVQNDGRKKIYPRKIVRSVGLQVSFEPLQSVAKVNGHSNNEENIVLSDDEKVANVSGEDQKENMGRRDQLSSVPSENKTGLTVSKLTNQITSPNRERTITRHPPALPQTPLYPPSALSPPERPNLMINKTGNGVRLSWNMQIDPSRHEVISAYQVYMYQQTSRPPVGSDPWKLVDQVKALPLPMECTLVRFFTGCKYYFSIRAIDIQGRAGPFSQPIGTAL